jgi:hypothetical protein
MTKKYVLQSMNTRCRNPENIPIGRVAGIGNGKSASVYRWREVAIAIAASA